jgi:hypothetical protein
MCAANDSAPLRLDRRLLGFRRMDTRTTPPSFADDDAADTIVDPPGTNFWFNEKTAQLDFERHELSGEAKLVAGYLTMEQHGLFADLPVEEQMRIVATLKR